MANANINYTHSAGLAPSAIEQFYEKTLLKDNEAELVHGRDMVKISLPAHNGKRIQFRTFEDLPIITEPLLEGVVPDGQTLRATERFITIKPKGGYITLTDEIDWGVLDNVHQVAAEKLRRQALESIDADDADAMNSGFNVIYADASTVNTSRAAITTGDNIKFSDIKMAVRTLEKNNAARFPDGFYHAVIDPETKYDLTADTRFISIADYQDKSKIEKYEVGTIYGVKFFESTKAKVFKTESYLYGSTASVALTAGTVSTASAGGTVTVAVATVATNASDTKGIAEYTRKMVNRMVMINDSSASAYIPVYIDKIELVGTNLIHHLRFAGTTYSWGSGDTLVPNQGGASSLVVHSTIVYGKEFCGAVALEGNGRNVQVKIKPAGSAGTADPLDQISTIGWKCRGYGSGILHENYGVRIEHAVSA